MTETTGVISFQNNRMCSPHPGAAGPLAPSVEAQIVDTQMKQRLSPYQTGEIWIRGHFMMKGYLNNHEATMETVDKQDWLHTGYFDDEGQLYIVDRIKELIKYKCFQISEQVHGGWIQKFRESAYRFPDSEKALADAIEAAGSTLGPVLLSMSEYLMSSMKLTSQACALGSVNLGDYERAHVGSDGIISGGVLPGFAFWSVF